MADIKPFKISIPDAGLEDLQARLSLAKFPKDELDGAGWDYGSPLQDVKRLTAYWREAYDWRKAEAELNTHPHFLTTIQCTGFEPLEIHFLHQRSHVADAIPLLFVHGWPGSFLEALKIYKPLSDPGPNSKAPAFHFVALSLPNYGFSEGSKKKGFAIAQYAETCNRLMLKLGYNEYVTQGGDWVRYGRPPSESDDTDTFQIGLLHHKSHVSSISTARESHSRQHGSRCTANSPPESNSRRTAQPHPIHNPRTRRP